LVHTEFGNMTCELRQSNRMSVDGVAKRNITNKAIIFASFGQSYVVDVQNVYDELPKDGQGKQSPVQCEQTVKIENKNCVSVRYTQGKSGLKQPGDIILTSSRDDEQQNLACLQRARLAQLVIVSNNIEIKFRDALLCIPERVEKDKSLTRGIYKFDQGSITISLENNNGKQYIVSIEAVQNRNDKYLY
jgi:hypothetical protein